MSIILLNWDDIDAMFGVHHQPIPKMHMLTSDERILFTDMIVPFVPEVIDLDRTRDVYDASIWHDLWSNGALSQRDMLVQYGQDLREIPTQLSWHLGRVLKWVDIEYIRVLGRKNFVSKVIDSIEDLDGVGLEAPVRGGAVIPFNTKVQRIGMNDFIEHGLELYNKQCHCENYEMAVEDQLPADRPLAPIGNTDDWNFGIEQCRHQWNSVMVKCLHIELLQRWLDKNVEDDVLFGRVPGASEINPGPHRPVELVAQDAITQVCEEFKEIWSTDEGFTRGDFHHSIAGSL